MFSSAAGSTHQTAASKLAARRSAQVGAGGGAFGSAGGAGSAGVVGRTATSARVRQELTEEQRKEIEEAFRVFDMDNDKRLDYHELKVAMRALGFDARKSEVADILRENERGDPGYISADSFFRVMSEKVLARDPLEEIRRAFALFDEDQTGKISLRNLRSVAKELNENLQEDELEAMINEFDLDGDGEINLDEFIAICSDN
ncbi:uncharacterized protein V1516DRAFT_629476 [Lipomyces oligophaga]|uniref:uncharacterized protein n=1 Tax=Lipomyces oligophaga TaxID=45792 RepID=UPI0034CE59F0